MLERMTKPVASLILVDVAECPADMSLRVRTASRPMSVSGCAIVVSAGVMSSEPGELSKPITEIAPGTRTP